MGFYQFFGSAERPVYDMIYAVPAAIIKSVVDVCEIQSGRVQRSGVTLRNYVGRALFFAKAAAVFTHTEATAFLKSRRSRAKRLTQ